MSKALSDDQTEVLISWVQEHPCIWDKKNPMYKNTVRKDRLLVQLADDLKPLSGNCKVGSSVPFLLLAL